MKFIKCEDDIVFFGKNEEEVLKEIDDYYGYEVKNNKHISLEEVKEDFENNPKRIMLITYNDGSGVLEEVLKEIYEDENCYNVILCN